VWGTIPSVDDFAIICNGKVLDMETVISDLFPADASLAEKTFRLKVQKLRGGGVRKTPKQKREEREKRFRSMKGNLVSITTGVGASPSGMDAELFNKCGDAVAKLQAEAAPATLEALVPKRGPWCPHHFTMRFERPRSSSRYVGYILRIQRADAERDV